MIDLEQLLRDAEANLPPASLYEVKALVGIAQAIAEMSCPSK